MKSTNDHEDDDAENPATAATTAAAEAGAGPTTPVTISATNMDMDVLPSPSSLTNNDDELFQNFSTSTIAQIVQFSPSIVVVEVWCLDEDTGLLVLEKGGSWTSPTLLDGRDDTGIGVSLREDGATIPPGVDLAGTLWTAAAAAKTKKGKRVNKFRGRGGRSIASSLEWHNLEALLEDPDTAKGEEGHDGGVSNNRIEKYRALGIERAAGVPFETNDNRGIVVFMATGSSRNASADGGLFELSEHDNFLHQVATLLSTTVAMQKTRLQLIEKSASLGTSSQVLQHVSKKCCSCCETVPGCVACTKKVKTVLHKSKGGGMPVPRGMSTPQSLFTWFGCFIALLILSGVESIVVKKTEFLLFAGPLGALAMLQYGVTQAPTSQPRNAILGQIVAGPIAIAVSHIPGIPQWLKVSLGVSTVSAIMTRLGIAHPPAASTTVLYLQGNRRWQNYVITLISVVISIVVATIINNFSDKRQYPTYWTGPLIKHLKNLMKKLHVSGYCRKENQEETHHNDVGKDATRCSTRPS